MDLVLIAVVSLLAALLTLYSGFGLGTVLLPAFALFLPLPVAVAATAAVHLANNLFKVGLVGRHADRDVLLRFVLPALPAAAAGAWALRGLGDLPPIVTYRLGDTARTVSPLPLALGIVVVSFALLDLLPALRDLRFAPRWLPAGGVLSGFFGGLSGHQGALRSAFLLRAGLGKEAFIGTGTVAAVAVDLVRLAVYGLGAGTAPLQHLPAGAWRMVAAGTVAAFLGSYLGARTLPKVTLGTVHRIVGIALVAFGLALALGLA